MYELPHVNVKFCSRLQPGLACLICCATSTPAINVRQGSARGKQPQPQRGSSCRDAMSHQHPLPIRHLGDKVAHTCCQRDAIDPGNPRCSVTSRLPMSTPSSMALVAATPHSSPCSRARSISRRSCGQRQVLENGKFDGLGTATPHSPPCSSARSISRPSCTPHKAHCEARLIARSTLITAARGLSCPENDLH